MMTSRGLSAEGAEITMSTPSDNGGAPGPSPHRADLDLDRK